MYSGIAMNKKTEMLPKLVWYIVIIIPTKNSVIIMLYRGIGTSFKLGIRTRLTIKNANVTNTVMRTIFGMVCENNVKKATSPPLCGNRNSSEIFHRSRRWCYIKSC